jgi:2Fe-2S ferredoxin
MPTIKVVTRNDIEQELTMPAGGVLMEVLRDLDGGVLAICGGMCTCATCHVYVDADWVSKLPAAQSDETEMLSDLGVRRENSRLSCQLQLTDALDGMRVTIAPAD